MLYNLLTKLTSACSHVSLRVADPVQLLELFPPGSLSTVPQTALEQKVIKTRWILQVITILLSSVALENARREFRENRGEVSQRTNVELYDVQSRHHPQPQRAVFDRRLRIGNWNYYGMPYDETRCNYSTSVTLWCSERFWKETFCCSMSNRFCYVWSRAMLCIDSFVYLAELLLSANPYSFWGGLQI